MYLPNKKPRNCWSLENKTDLSAIKNRKVLVSGLTTGLIGLAIGNYLGLGLYWLLDFVMS